MLVERILTKSVRIHKLQILVKTAPRYRTQRTSSNHNPHSWLRNGTNISGVLDKIRSGVKEQEFLTNRFSLVINPVYIIRIGLVKAIEDKSNFVTGDVLDFGCGSKPHAVCSSARKTISVSTFHHLDTITPAV
jgi:hypothetical protein